MIGLVALVVALAVFVGLVFLAITLLRIAGVMLVQWRDLISVDRWLEVLDTIRRNKLRTALTMISVAWGIFVLVFLFGLGKGLDRGLRTTFAREATNGIWIFARKTTIPHNGYDIGRKITFDNRDYERAKTVKLPGPNGQGIDHLSGQYYIHGDSFGGGTMMTRRNNKANAFQINAVHPDAFYLTQSKIDAGRFLNADDIAQHRKTVVIGEAVRSFLFEPDENPIGEWITIASVASLSATTTTASSSGAGSGSGSATTAAAAAPEISGGVPFQVVGVFSDPAGAEEERQIYIPVSTAQLSFNGADHLGALQMTVGTANAAEAKQISDLIVAQLAERHQFDPKDPMAARVHSNVEGFERFSKLFWMISTFVVVIGLGTLAAGVVGVSNIMMIAVKERTKEIGVRKALGATPSSIVAMIIQEAVFLTGLAGFFGLAAGVALLEVVSRNVENEFIKNPAIDLKVGILASLGLVIAGALAGFFPARAAARVNPINALRDQ
ncbi:MAG TPA: ABC transporter permease [Kofleriaceae bacterium]|nr:ABC transporter permease [Kofleriaceae bacterium]